jgi:tetratricopeptide (TPR) repeat protein
LWEEVGTGPGSLAARRAYERALRLDPRFLPARRALASLLRRQGNPGEALAVVEAGLRWPYSDDRPVGLFLQAADLHWQQGRRDEARRLARKALKRTNNPRLARSVGQRFGLDGEPARHPGRAPIGDPKNGVTEGKI